MLQGASSLTICVSEKRKTTPLPPAKALAISTTDLPTGLLSNNSCSGKLNPQDLLAALGFCLLQDGISTRFKGLQFVEAHPMLTLMLICCGKFSREESVTSPLTLGSTSCQANRWVHPAQMKFCKASPLGDAVHDVFQVLLEV